MMILCGRNELVLMEAVDEVIVHFELRQWTLSSRAREGSQFLKQGITTAVVFILLSDREYLSSELWMYLSHITNNTQAEKMF